MSVTRRGLFKLGALTGAVVTLPEAAQKVLPGMFRTEPEPLPPQGEEHWPPAACPHCGAGLLARVIKGRAVGIKGDPQHPVSRGALCPQGASLTQALYHPDHLRGPLRRTGERGQGKWQPLSWDEALTECARHVKEALSGASPRIGLFLGPTDSVVTRTLWTRFAQAVGASDPYETRLPAADGPTDAAVLMMGARNGITFDLQHAEFVLSLGADWLQNSRSPVEVTRAYGSLRRGRTGHRARVLSAEPRLSMTASKADEWIPIRPATEGALALGIAHVLLRDHLYDEAFVQQNTVGFEAFKDRVLQAYAPASVAEVTGVPTDRIEQLAKEFAAGKPAVALCDRTSLADQMAALALNALAGNIGQAGGVRQKLWDLAAMPLPAPAPTAGLSALDALQVLVLHRANPLFWNVGLWRKALERASFIVSLTSFMDDTSLHADLILPEHTPLEALTDGLTWTLSGARVLSVSNPAVKPLYDTRHAGDVILELARCLGEPVASKFAWDSYEDALKEMVKPIFESKRGKQLREIELEEESFFSEKAETFDLWFKKLCKAGGWAEETGAEQAQPPIFATASGKFEFHAEKLEDQTPPQDPPGDLWFHLCLYVPLVFAGGEGAHLPYLQGIAGARLGERQWETWVEIHPATAGALGISDGEWVAVESSAGSLRARAVFFQGARPDAVNIPFGLGHAAYGRWAAGVGANPANLLPTDPATGEPRWRSTRVRIVKEGV